MNEIAFIELLKLVEADASIGADAKAKFKTAVHQIGAQHGAKKLARQERWDFARHLLDMKEERIVICCRLIARFNVSERQAYRDIERALNLCQKWPLDGRKALETISIEVATE